LSPRFVFDLRGHFTTRLGKSQALIQEEIEEVEKQEYHNKSESNRRKRMKKSDKRK
ncbi:hypothetical protein LCGC14_1805020, partial [marine sediment metagenome]